ncbi:AAEL006812-PA [Aedes aegypti]|uniref:AAEL006812-PA n=1 Tax=Aedes aegypti TaxID=7159 RepID=Q174R5_AEDAE|nr:AAEL006812-PA [Aedes aegypti]
MESFSLLSCRMCLRIPADDVLTFSVSDTFKGKQLDDLIGQLFGIKVNSHTNANFASGLSGKLEI